MDIQARWLKRQVDSEFDFEALFCNAKASVCPYKRRGQGRASALLSAAFTGMQQRSMLLFGVGEREIKLVCWGLVGRLFSIRSGNLDSVAGDSTFSRQKVSFNGVIGHSRPGLHCHELIVGLSRFTRQDEGRVIAV